MRRPDRAGREARRALWTVLGAVGIVVASADASVVGTEPGGALRQATFLGGNGRDAALRLTTDAEGNVYVTGGTSSFEIAGQPVENRGGLDVYIARLTPDWLDIDVVAFGGAFDDLGTSVHVLEDGRVVVVGHAGPGLETTPDAYQPDYGGGSLDLFVAVLDEDLEPSYLTYLGGAGQDEVERADVTADGRVLLAGFTSSTHASSPPFPITAGALQELHGGGTWDALLVAFRPDGLLPRDEQLVYSTYIGGSGSELQSRGSHAVAAHEDGRVAIVGQTSSTNFPAITPLTALQTSNGGFQDGYLVVLRPDVGIPPQEQLVYGTYFGGGNDDATKDLTWLRDGGIAVTGWSWSTNLPQADNSNRGRNDGFVWVVDESYSLVLSSYFGGAEPDTPTEIVETGDGSLLICGRTISSNFPALAPICPFQSIDQAFFLRYVPDPSTPPAERIAFSSPLGGSSAPWGDGNDYAFEVVVEPDGSAIVCGRTGDSRFPADGDALQSVHAGGTIDGFLARVDTRVPEPRWSATPSTGPAPLTSLLDASASTTPEGTEITRYEWEFGDGAVAEGPTIEHRFDADEGEGRFWDGLGRHVVSLTVENSLGIERSTSEEVTAVLGEQSRPEGWTASDFGSTRFPGGTRAGPGVVTPEVDIEMCAGGRALFGSSMGFHFLHREISGDFDLSAWVETLHGDEVGTRSGVGLLVRDTEDDGARTPYFALQIERPSGLVGPEPELKARWRDFRFRSEDLAELPVMAGWLRISRRGETFTCYTSDDGESWEQVGEPVVVAELSTTVLAGVSLFKTEPLTAPSAFVPVGAGVSGLTLEVAPETAPRFFRGATNDDLVVDIADPIYTLAWLFNGGPEPGCFDAADADDSGTIELTDAILVLGSLFTGGVDPQPPFPQCGVDPTDDALGCERFAACAE